MSLFHFLMPHTMQDSGLLTDDVVVVFAPGDVEDGALVARHQGMVRRHAAILKWCWLSFSTSMFNSFYLVQGKYEKSSTSPRLDNARYKLGVDTAECGVPGGFGDSDVVIALVSLVVCPEDVSELGLTNNTERHFEPGRFSAHLYLVFDLRYKHQTVYIYIYLKGAKNIFT